MVARVSFCPQCGAYLPESIESCPCGFVIPAAAAERPVEHALDEIDDSSFPASTPAIIASTPLPASPFLPTATDLSIETSRTTSTAPAAEKTTALVAATLLVLVVFIAAAVVYRKTYSFSAQPDRAFTPTARTETTVPKAVPQNVGQAQSITNSGAGPGSGNQPAMIENRFLVGTYLGTIGTRDFKLFIDRVSGEDVEGYDVAGTNRRPVMGHVVSKRTEPTGLGGYGTIFKLILNEPGDDKWDGEFNIDLSISDISRQGEGTWRSFDGKLKRYIRISDPANSGAGPGEAELESKQGDYRTGTFLDGFLNVDARVLKPGDISGLSAQELGLLRNFIYARHGRPFAKPTYRLYFSQFGWYRVDPSYTDSLLNQMERENGEIIRRRERAIGVAE